MAHAASSDHIHINPGMHGNFSLAIYHHMRRHSEVENMYMLMFALRNGAFQKKGSVLSTEKHGGRPNYFPVGLSVTAEQPIKFRIG